MSDRELISTDWNVRTDWKGNAVEPTVEIQANDPSGFEEPYFVVLTIPEAKDFLRELQADIIRAEKYANNHFNRTHTNSENIGES